MELEDIGIIKGALRDPQPHPPTYSKKVEIFIPSEALDHIMFMCISFLADSDV